MRWLWLCLWLLWSADARAHDFTMSVLELRELSAGEFQARWERLQGVQDPSAAYLLLRPRFPDPCRLAPPRLSCAPEGLRGTMGFAGLGELSTTAMIRVRWRDGLQESYAFSARQPQVLVARRREPSGLARVACAFVWTGIEHIWWGWDHLLFVLGLLWLVRTKRALLLTVTSFTLAHSLTLGAAAWGRANVPTPPVEAVIALSIVFLAREVANQGRTGERDITGCAPWIVAFVFGLLHGFGFASALSGIEVPRAELPLALLSFNVGVELGQLAFVALIWLIRSSVVQRAPVRATRALSVGAQYAMGTLGAYWFIERVLAF